MKLEWSNGLHLSDGYVADGENYSYSVALGFTAGLPPDMRWIARQYNSKGELIRRNVVLTAEGGKQRAQAWEDDQ